MIAFVGLSLAGVWDAARDRRVDGWVPAPAPEARAAYGALVRDLARAAPTGRVPRDADTRARALGLELRVRDGAALLVEAAGGAAGAGLVAVRLGPLPCELVLAAPHPVTDLHTGAIAGALFDAGDVRAVYLATTWRDAGPDMDPAHAPASWLSTASDALADALDDPLFVQVHGFAEDRTEADVVVSDGAAPLPPWHLAAAVDAITRGLGVGDVRTGDEVPALAARTNAQGKLLAGRARFLHVELSPAVRTSLLADPAPLGGVLLDLAER
ncbi:MAG: hypothetical protein ACOZNI_26675 [Myxococcota bacterium]